MTVPAPAAPRPPAPVTHAWPAVFDGKGALVVSCALDPQQLARKLDPGTSWICAKLTGTDTGGDAEVRHCLAVWRQLGLKVGGWIYNLAPGSDVASLKPWLPLDFVVYDVESPYKADEGGHYEYAQRLVTLHATAYPDLTAAVTSYGGYKTSIDFGAFAQAGWPILAQVYDSFRDGDEQSYRVVYPSEGIHRLTRRLSLFAGEAVYRPESL